MWITIFVMALAVSMEPFRIGMAVLMLGRPRPRLQLLTFLCGGFAMGLTVGVIVLFAMRPLVMRSTYFTVPKAQIVIGVLALAVAAILVATPRRGDRRPAMLATRTRQLLNGSSLWVAGFAGMGIALPSADYLSALAVILASGAAAMTQVSALVMFNIVAFALVEIPLVASLVAPDKTRVWMGAVNDWVRSRSRRDVAVLLAVVGGVLLAIGIAGL